MSRQIGVLAAVLDAMLEHARRDAPLECCGLLAGRDDLITRMFPARNALASASEYSIDPQELISAFRSMRESGLTHLGIYHSHPHSENTPSPRDIELAYYPDCAYFIVSLAPLSGRAIRAFEIRDGRAMELEVVWQ